MPLSRVCRTCLSDNIENIDMFDPSNVNDIPNQIRSFVNMEVPLLLNHFYI